MAVHAGIEGLLSVNNKKGIETGLAVGSLLKLTHTVESEQRKDEYVYQGFLLVARPTTYTEVYVDELTSKKEFVKTPSVIYSLGEVMLISCNEEPVFEPQPDRVLYSTDSSYNIEVMPPVASAT